MRLINYSLFYASDNKIDDSLINRIKEIIVGDIFAVDLKYHIVKSIYNGDVKSQSFSGDNEKELLRNCKKVLDKCYKLDFHICGHNLKNFDIPMLAKRMIINGISPSVMLPSYDTKPWEVKAIDTKDVWQYGAYTSIGSLDLLCTSLGVPSPKEGEITGDKVHTAYWNDGKLKEITEYCERDVRVLIDIIIKLKELE